MNSQNFRKDPRIPSVGPISYCLDHDASDQRYSGIMIDTSREGMGIYTSKPLEEGESIRIYRVTMGSQPVTATVKWCTKVPGDLFRIGISFN